MAIENRAQFVNYSAAWTRFGALQHVWFEQHGLVHTNLRLEHIGFSDNYEAIQVMKAPGAVTMEYPRQWPNILEHLQFLVKELDDFPMACFRLGFMQYGGPLGRHVFNVMRSMQGFHAFRKMEHVKYAFQKIPDTSSSADWVEPQQNWIAFRASLEKVGSLLEKKWRLDSLNEYRKIAKEAKPSKVTHHVALEYFHVLHLAAAWYHQHRPHMVDALYNLAVLNAARGAQPTATGLLQSCNELIRQDQDVYPEAFQNQVAELYQQAQKALPARARASLELLDDLEVNDIFHRYWCLEDLSYGHITLENVAVG
ncbi:MAG: hypothetical protein AAF570_04610 [Bacteroidota bacterium]